MDVSCLICKRVMSHKGIFTHYDRAHLGVKTYASGNNGNYKKTSATCKVKRDAKIAEYNKLPKRCAECNLPLAYDKRCNNFCNSSCGATHSNKLRIGSGWTPSTAQRKKVSTALSGRKIVQREMKICETCDSVFEFLPWYGKGRFCSLACSHRRHGNKIVDLTQMKEYRKACLFKFNILDYPDEFDNLLIEKHGWYITRTKNKNTTGVSKDHMVSVRYGYDNNISPVIISHPANCLIMLHLVNSSKNAANSMTLENLLKRIEHWNCKYPPNNR